MVKEKIIRGVLHLFKQYGIRSVSMNLIAEELRMSKRTIYEEFEHKDEIVKESIRYEISRAHEALCTWKREADNALIAIAQVSTNLSRYSIAYCPAFFRDLRFFPDAEELIRTFRRDIEKMYFQLFQRGIEEGLFLPDADYEVVAQIFMGQFEQLKPEFQASMSLTFLRGVSTEKGIGELEKMAWEVKMQSN